MQCESLDLFSLSLSYARQERGKPPAFDVATVKVNRSGEGRSSYPQLTNGRMTAHNATLRMILRSAYGLSALQINGPDWMDSDRFDLMRNPRPVSRERTDAHAPDAA